MIYEISDDHGNFINNDQDHQSGNRFLDHFRAILVVLRSRADREGEYQWMGWLSEWNRLTLARPSENDLLRSWNSMRNLWGVERNERAWLCKVTMARRTRRLREYRLYLQLRASELGIQHSPSAPPPPQPLPPLNVRTEAWLTSELVSRHVPAAELPADIGPPRELNTRDNWNQAPRPENQLRPMQGDWLLKQLWRRGAFSMAPMDPTNTLRENWDRIRNAGYVYDPDKVSEDGKMLGTWSLAPY